MKYIYTVRYLMLDVLVPSSSARSDWWTGVGTLSIDPEEAGRLVTYPVDHVGTGHEEGDNRASFGIEIECHSSGKPEDNRPRIYAEFEGSEFNRDRLSVLLDTGAHSSVMFKRPSTCQRGYVTGGRGKRVAGAIEFGVVDKSEEMRIVKQVPDVVNFGPGFRYPLELSVSESCSDPYLGAGLVGADRTSPFAKAAQVFSFRPSNNVARVGTVQIGERFWPDYCESELVKVGLHPILGQHHWVVEGSVGLNGEMLGINWLIDTGATGLMVSQYILMRLVWSIQTVGGHMPRIQQAEPSLVYNCVSNWRKFPTVEVTLGTNAFTVLLGPEHYLDHFDIPSGTCYLMIDSSTMTDLPNTGILGMLFIQHVFTVFDRRNDQAAFCAPRF